MLLESLLDELDELAAPEDDPDELDELEPLAEPVNDCRNEENALSSEVCCCCAAALAASASSDADVPNMPFVIVESRPLL